MKRYCSLVQLALRALACVVGWTLSGGVLAASFPSPQAAFTYLHKVATSPRCGNCHGTVLPTGAHIPTTGDQRRPHPMNVQSTLTDLGMKCTTCHQTRNVDEPGGPPGAANDLMPDFLWHMPDRSMVIPANMAPADLCEHWLNRATNGKEINRGGRDDMATFKREFLHHMQADPLVHWAFAPGLGRTPAPGSKDMLIEAMRVWLDGGAPCP